MSIENRLALLNQQRLDLVSAVNSKGGSLTTDNMFPEIITGVQDLEVGGEPVDDWVYPSEWPEIRDVGDDEILLLVTDSNPFKVRVNTSNSDGYNISFGDGTSSDQSNGSSILHDYTNSSGYTIDPLTGQKLWLVRIIPNGSANLRNLQALRPSETYGPCSTPIVAASFGGMFINSWFYSSVGPFTSINYKTYSHNLIYCKIKSFGVATTAQELFRDCDNLKKVDLPTSFGSLQGIRGFFQSCSSIKNISLPSSWGSVTDIYQFCLDCRKLQNINLPDTWGNIGNLSSVFSGCYELKNITLPNSWGNASSTANMFSMCTELSEITLPSSWGNVTGVNSMFQGSGLKKITLPSSWGNITSIIQFLGGTKITSIEIPPFDKVTTASSLFSGCYSLFECTILGWGVVTDVSYMFYGCRSIRNIVLPAASGSWLVNCNYFTDANTTSSNIIFTNIDYLGSSTSDTSFVPCLGSIAEPISLNLQARISRLLLNGVNGYPTNIVSLRLPNAINSLFTGNAPHINVSYTNLDSNALNLLFSDLPTISGKTINISGALGASTCDKSLATSKGWTVVG